MNRRTSAVTLVELLMALVLLSIIVLGISQIEIFSNFHLISTDRQAKINNEASLALEYMNKQIMQAVGNEIIGGPDSVVQAVASAFPNDDNNQISFAIDTNNDGTADTIRAYRYRNNSAPAGSKNQIWYCPQCPAGDMTCATCTPAWGTQDNTIARNINSFTPCKPIVGGTCTSSGTLEKNYVTIQIQGCWDPTQTYYSCGTQDNPSVDMKADIKMPSVSTN